MKGKFRRVKIADLKKRPLRSDNGSKEDCIALAASWLKRPMHPIVVRPDLTVVDGHRRLEGLEASGETEVTVFVTDEDLTLADLIELGLETALHREGLKPYDQAVACREWFVLNPGATAAELAKKIGRDSSMVLRLMSLWKTTPATEAAAKEGKIGPKAWYQISLLAEDKRDGMLAMYTSGMSTSQVEDICKKQRKTATKADGVTLSRVTCPLSTGTKVVITGPEMSLSAMIDALQSALELARKSNKDQIDIRTAEKVWRDRARASAS